MTYTCIKCGDEYEAEDSPSDFYCNQYCYEKAVRVVVSRADKEDHLRAMQDRENGTSPRLTPIEIPPRAAFSPMGLWAYARWLTQQASANEDDPDNEG